MNSPPKIGAMKKINQRLFKRLILYYNVGESPNKISTKTDSAPSAWTDDSRLAVDQTTRTRPAGTAAPSAALPFNMAEAGDRHPDHAY